MAQKKRDEEEIAAVRQELPLEPPADVLEKVKARMKEGRLVYRVAYVTDPLTSLKIKCVCVKCTECGEKVYYPYAVKCRSAVPFGFLDAEDGKDVKVTGSACVCTQCGAKAQAMHVGSFKRYGVIDKKYFMTIHNIRGHFVALSWVVFKEYNKDAEISYKVYRYEGAALIGGRPIRYTGYDIFSMYGFSWGKEWQTRAVWRDNGDEWEADEIFFDRDVIESSDAAKSAIDVYIRDIKSSIRVCAFLQLWARNPAVENLVRSGLSHFVSNVIDAATDKSYYAPHCTFSIKRAEMYFDRKRVKPHEIIGIEKERMALANEWPVDRLYFYREASKTQNTRLSDSQLKDAEKIGYFKLADLMGTARRIGVKAPVVRTINYLKKQMRKDLIVDPQYLADYWNMTREIQGDVPSELAFPEDLHHAHDLAFMRQKEKVDKKIDRNISEYSETLSYLEYQDEETGLMIRAAKNQTELIKEGKILHHCVGSYAGRVSRRETAILFIRKTEEPDLPFFTLEYNNGKVIQNRGIHNCSRTEEVSKFEKKWLEHIKGGRVRNGKRNNQTTRQRAGA